MLSSHSQSLSVPPMDGHNQTLISNVRPSQWINPKPASRYNLVVVGAGPAGLVAASGAAGLGAKVALVEKHLLGGDCLNVGCVPSKAIIRSSRVAAEVREAGRFGVQVPEGTQVDFSSVMERMRRLRAKISAHDSAERLKAQGVDLFFGEPRFTSPNTLEVAGQTLKFSRAVITTGARPGRLPIEGLEEAGYLTNETVFRLTERPQRLACIGAGPLGCELAQAFHRLGCEVTLLEVAPRIMGREDEDAAELLRQVFLDEGIRLVLGCSIQRVSATNRGGSANPFGGERHSSQKIIHYAAKDHRMSITVDQILLGVGRVPNVEGLNLETAGISYDPKRGIQVNGYLQTTNPRIYAAGDVCMVLKFTHAADAAARLVLENALFFRRRKLSTLTVPWCTYTDPEVAHVGMVEADAEKASIPVATFVKRFSDVDRAVVDSEEGGFVKIHVRKGTDQILGATIVARHAGEMINEITLAMANGVGLGALANVIHPYPTQTEAIRQVGDAYQMGRLTPGLKRLLERWFAWKRRG